MDDVSISVTLGRPNYQNFYNSISQSKFILKQSFNPIKDYEKNDEQKDSKKVFVMVFLEYISSCRAKTIILSSSIDNTKVLPNVL